MRVVTGVGASAGFSCGDLHPTARTAKNAKRVVIDLDLRDEATTRTVGNPRQSAEIATLLVIDFHHRRNHLHRLRARAQRADEGVFSVAVGAIARLQLMPSRL